MSWAQESEILGTVQGEFVERELFEAALPLVRRLFGDEAERVAGGGAESAVRELVRTVVDHLFRSPRFPDLTDETLAPVLAVVDGAVGVLARRSRASIRGWGREERRLADLLLSEVQHQGLSEWQMRDVRQLLVIVCRLAIDFAGGALPGDADFERRYRDHVVERYGTTSLVGAPVDGRTEVELGLTYVPLKADVRADAQPRPRPLDDLFQEYARLLLRGTAGSGKTTALQWLAVRTARDVWPGLYDEIVLVPFFLPVRALLRQGLLLPGPHDLLSAVDCPFPAPAGWAQRVLAQGRGVLLVDGVDEVPESERGHVRQWLGELCAAYPLNYWVVSCRPDAVGDGWLADLEFKELRVAPFSAGDIREFVRRWYRFDAAAPPGREESLLALFRERTDLAEIATNPFLCAVLCALHGEGAGRLVPRSRAGLYAELLAMLLERRDAERGIDLGLGRALLPETQLTLLGDLAYWMVRNWQKDVSYDRARLVIESGGPRASAGLSPDEIVKHLVNRSGVLCPLPGRVIDFAHRPFQDHLTARSLVWSGDFGLLAEHAGDDRWRDIFLCAMGLARPRDRTLLLDLVLERGDAARERSEALRFYLLAAAGLAEASVLDPGVAQAVRDRVAGQLPPRNAAEAARFARLGPAVLDLLPDPARMTGDETAPLLDLLARIPGPEAAAAALRFAPPPATSEFPASLRGLPEPSPGARQLAIALSVATRIEPELIRAVRLHVFPLLDVGAESDLWFSSWTAAQTPQAMALRTELLPYLRSRLARRLATSAPKDPIRRLGAVVERVHTELSPALRIEERLNWLDVTGTLTSEGGPATADALLLPALRALVEERREGIADWLAGAWPRLPSAVRETTTAWQLVTAAVHSVPDAALDRRAAPAGVTADDVAVIVDAVGDAVLTVARSGGLLILGAGQGTAQDTAIVVPDTDPRVVEVLGDGAAFRTVTVSPGETRSVPVGAGQVRLRTPRGDIYELGREAGVGAGHSQASEGIPDEPESRNGPYFFRTSARALATMVPEVAADVWRAEGLKGSEERLHRARLFELQGLYEALAGALIEAGLGEVEVLLGELGGPGDEPTDVTLAGYVPPDPDELTYVCVELSNMDVLAVDRDEPRLVQIGGHSHWVHPLERARARQKHLFSRLDLPTDQHVTSSSVAYLPGADTASGPVSHDGLSFIADMRPHFIGHLRTCLGPWSGVEAADVLLSTGRTPLPSVLAAVGQDLLPHLHPFGRQTLAVGTAMAAVRRRQKQVVVVTGAAGTGKTAVALRLYTEAYRLGADPMYTFGPTEFERSVERALTEWRLRHEAHRSAPPRTACRLLIHDGGRFRENRSIDVLLEDVDVAVFLIDEDTVLRPGETRQVDLIRATAEERGTPVDVLRLTVPVRFGGSAAYLGWVTALLAADEDAVPWIPDDRHTVLMADSPHELEAFLQAREEDHAVRMTAGLCWPGDSGVGVGQWHRPWHLALPGTGTGEVDTPHSVQGYEYDWCGVILGPDFLYREGRWITAREANADPDLGTRIPAADADRLIRNAYRVLLTRSRTGVALFSTDAETQEALRRLVPGRVSDH